MFSASQIQSSHILSNYRKSFDFAFVVPTFLHVGLPFRTRLPGSADTWILT
jgi:hypothetical protein